jgi:SAM-dependent methyltransferase
MGSFHRLNALACRVRRASAVPPYALLSGIYDDLMNHVDYGDWAGYITRLFSVYGREVHTVLEGGCGTGLLSASLSERGYNSWGFDVSPAMIRIARSRGVSHVWVADLGASGARRGWDAFLCLYDTIQYLFTDQLKAFLESAGPLVKPGGLCIFDIVTEMSVDRYWNGYRESGRKNGWTYSRESWYNRKNRVLTNDFQLLDLRRRRRYSERHRQYIYRVNDIYSIAEGSGWKPAGCLKDFTLESGDETADRLHFVFIREGL